MAFLELAEKLLRDLFHIKCKQSFPFLVQVEHVYYVQGHLAPKNIPQCLTYLNPSSQYFSLIHASRSLIPSHLSDLVREAGNISENATLKFLALAPGLTACIFLPKLWQLTLLTYQSTWVPQDIHNICNQAGKTSSLCFPNYLISNCHVPPPPSPKDNQPVTDRTATV